MDSKKKKRIIIDTLFFLCGVFFAWLWLSYASRGLTSAGNNTSQPLRLGQKGLVSPLLDYTTADNKFSQLISFSNDLSGRAEIEMRNGNATNVSIFFQDLDSGRWAGVNPNVKFSPASLLKVPVTLTYLKLAETQPGILSKTVFYDGSFDDNNKEDIKPLKTIQPGRSYTVDNLLRYMIEFSDNNATNLLFSTGVTMDQFNQTYVDVGVATPTSTDDFMSPRLFSRFFRVLYNGTYLNQAMSQKALEFLVSADFPQGIMAGVPEGITVAQKFGEHEFIQNNTADDIKELHDCGIVYHPNRPYAICIMTKGSDFTKLTSVISGISRAVWNRVDSNTL